MSGLEAYYDRQHATIYLNLMSLFEDSMFLNLCQTLSNALNTSSNAEPSLDIDSWLHSQENIELKLLLHAFLLSNLVFLVQDGSQFDLKWLELLKNVANLKSLLSTQADKTLLESTLFKRLLEGPTPSISIVFDITTAAKASNFQTLAQREAFATELQKVQEVQVKHLLKRPQFHQLFQISSGQCVHAVCLGDSPMEAIERMVNIDEGATETLNVSCGVRTLRKWFVSKIRALHGTAHALEGFVPKRSSQSEGDARRRRAKAPSKTLSEGWSLATSQEWFRLSHKVLQWLSLDSAVDIAFDRAALDPDHIFSEECCRHALSGARGTYHAGLPTTYGSSYHQKRLQLALRVFVSLARGPQTETAQSHFIAECASYWNSGHRKCDAVSVTNRPCVHAYHLTKDPHSESDKLSSGPLKLTAELAAVAPIYSPSSKSRSSFETAQSAPTSSSTSTVPKSTTGAANRFPLPTSLHPLPPSPAPPVIIPTMPHCSEFKSMHRCNCGKNQMTRLDPFDLVSANTTFFSNPECCRYLPSLLESMLSKARALEKESFERLKQVKTNRPSFKDIELLAMPHSLRLVNFPWEATVMGSVSECIKFDATSRVMNTASASPIPFSPTSTSHAPSASSPYIITHEATIKGQTGWTEGYSTLLPWALETQAISSSSSASNIVSSRVTSLLAYIGLEYECHGGHRWFATPQVLASFGIAPATSSSSSSSFTALDMQSILIRERIPIYTPCTCGKKTAQLQRIYVVTPKDPSVRLTFNLLVEVIGKTSKDDMTKRQQDKVLDDEEDDETPKLRLDSGIEDHLVLPPDTLVCIRLPYIYSFNDKPLLQGKLASNTQCRFFLEPRSFGLVTT